MMFLSLIQTLGGTPFSLPYILQVSPAGEFAYHTAISKLGDLGIKFSNDPQVNFVVPGDAHVTTDRADGDRDAVAGRTAHLLRLSGCIDVASRLTVRLS